MAFERTLLWELFELFDYEGNGSIDLAELPVLIRALGFAPSEEECSRLLRRYELNKDGVLLFEDFFRICNSGVFTPVPGTDELRAAFEVLDSGQQGSLSVLELAEALRTRGEPLDEATLSEMFGEEVVDSTRRVNFNEFVKLLVGTVSQRSSNTEASV